MPKKSKRGRPPKKKSEVFNYRYSIRCKRSQHLAWEKQAEEEGMETMTWARSILNREAGVD